MQIVKIDPVEKNKSLYVFTADMNEKIPFKALGTLPVDAANGSILKSFFGELIYNETNDIETWYSKEYQNPVSSCYVNNETGELLSIPKNTSKDDLQTFIDNNAYGSDYTPFSISVMGYNILDGLTLIAVEGAGEEEGVNNTAVIGYLHEPLELPTPLVMFAFYGIMQYYKGKVYQGGYVAVPIMVTSE